MAGQTYTWGNRRRKIRRKEETVRGDEEGGMEGMIGGC